MRAFAHGTGAPRTTDALGPGGDRLAVMSRGISTDTRTTPRLALRPFRRRDLESLWEAVHDSWPELAEWLPWAHAGYSRLGRGSQAEEDAIS